MNQGPIWGQFMKENSGQKSRATAPLRGISISKLRIEGSSTKGLNLAYTGPQLTF